MNPQEKQQVAARDDKWVPFSKRVRISSTNIRLETTMPQKEETFNNSGIPSRRFKALILMNFYLPTRSVLSMLKSLGQFLIYVQEWKFVKIGEDYQEYGLLILETMSTEAIKQSKSYQMFIKYSTGQILPKKSRGKDAARKKTSSKRRVKKKVTLSVDDNIISDDPDVALEIVTESAKKKSGGRNSKSVAIQDTPSAPKSKPGTSKTKLKGDPSLIPEEQEAANIMQALKESKKTSRRKPGTEGSNKGTGTLPGVSDEFMVFFGTSSEGTGIKPGVSNEENDITEEKVILEWGDEQDNEYSNDNNDDVEKDDKDGNADDEGDDHISDTQDVDDKDVEIESDEDDIYKYKIRVRKDEEGEMINAKVDDSDKGDEKITDAAKANAEKTLEVEDDAKKTELPPSSSSLSVSSVFSNKFLKRSSDSSLVSIVKDTTDSKINSLLEVKIQSEVPHTHYCNNFTSSICIHHTSCTSTNNNTDSHTTNHNRALTIIAVVPESNALTVVELRVAKLEKDVYLDSKVGDVFQKELQKHTANLIQKYSLQHLPEITKKPTPIDDQEEGSKKRHLDILKIKKEQAEKQ
ncbi:hypothetical protein Tco_0099464 [Tanacetum coccineum]